MPKIRGIKPDLWTDENFVELSPFARLLWMGMWNYACDNGHLQDKSKQIKMRVLPTDDVNCADLLREIEGQGLITRGDGWITIPNLAHHQKPHKRWYVVCEKLGCERPEGTSYGWQKGDLKPESTVEQPLVNDEIASDNGGSTADVDVDVDGELMVMVTRDPSSDKSDGANQLPRFDEWWDTYGNKTGRHKSEIAYKAALKKPGVTPELLIATTAAYVDYCRLTDTRLKNPLTWLHGEHWRDERKPPRPAEPESRVQGWLRLAKQAAEEDQTNVRAIGGSR